MLTQEGIGYAVPKPKCHVACALHCAQSGLQMYMRMDSNSCIPSDVHNEIYMPHASIDAASRKAGKQAGCGVSVTFTWPWQSPSSSEV